MDYIDSLVDDDDIRPPGAGMVVGLPGQWGGTPRNTYEIGSDYENPRNGRTSVYIRSLFKGVGVQSGVLTQMARADAYRGQRIRFSGWFKTSELIDGGAGLWFRSDGPGLQPFGNSPRITGTNDWQELSIVADIPESAMGFAFGALMFSPGIVWLDDFKFEIVDQSVPVTTLPVEATQDTVIISRTYDRIPMGPRNLDFEGLIWPSGTPETINWVRNQSFPFTTDDPAVPTTDLDPLRAMVGNATIVALGEATHGTREFFRMKHRMLEWLVREMDFSYFGIEATFPEALDVDRYVQTGEGDPSLLLGNLHFWTWHTQEVLDMIKWMRAWNAAGNQPRVHFVGFDMQFPGVAIDSAEAFAMRRGADVGAMVRGAYNCLTQFRQIPSVTGSGGMDTYRVQQPSFKDQCRTALQEVDTLFARRDAEWSAAEGPAKMRLARQMARLVSQWEESVAGRSTTPLTYRDIAMAENVAWWHDTQAPGEKMVLWAHNMHISRLKSWMGEHLTRRYGSGYLSIGQTFLSGSFNAVLQGFVPDTLPPLRSHFVLGTRDESIERVFEGTGLPRLIFDARKTRTTTDPAATPLLLPMSIRALGAAVLRNLLPTGYQVALTLRNDYDLIVWIQEGTASVLLPFERPAGTRLTGFNVKGTR
jgi:erythromycin esterase